MKQHDGVTVVWNDVKLSFKVELNANASLITLRRRYTIALQIIQHDCVNDAA